MVDGRLKLQTAHIFVKVILPSHMLNIDLLLIFGGEYLELLHFMTRFGVITIWVIVALAIFLKRSLQFYTQHAALEISTLNKKTLLMMLWCVVRFRCLEKLSFFCWYPGCFGR